MSKGHREWMKKLERGDLSGVAPKMEQFLQLPDRELKEHPRLTEAYKDQCLKEAGLGKHFDAERYPHLTEQVDRDLLAWAIKRGSGCIWLEGSETTYVRGFKHRLITRGQPVQTCLNARKFRHCARCFKHV